MDTLFSGATIVAMDDALRVLVGGFLGVEDGKISYIGKTPPQKRPKTIVECSGMVLMPGLINANTQLAFSLFRGCGSSVPAAQWRQEMLDPMEKKLTPQAVRAGAALSIAECLRNGITSVSHAGPFSREVCQAAADSGIKANIALNQSGPKDDLEPLDFDRDPDCRTLCETVEQWNGYDSGRIRIDAGIRSERESNYRLWEALGEYAASTGIGMQVPLSVTRQEHLDCLEQYGLTPAQLLDCHHVFDGPAPLAAHCMMLEPEDMVLLARRGVSAVFCPTAELRLGLGTAPVQEMVKAGMNVALGSGPAAACGCLDLFREMRAAALLAGKQGENSDVLPAAAALMMATVCGAKAQGRQASCGQLKPGMDADIILLDFTAPHLIPCHDVMNQLVFSASGGDVVMTMVQGKVLYRAGHFETIDLDQLVRTLAETALPQVFGPDEAAVRH